MSQEKIEQITIKINEIKNSFKIIDELLLTTTEPRWIDYIDNKIIELKENFKYLNQALVPIIAEKGDLFFEGQLHGINERLAYYISLCKLANVYTDNLYSVKKSYTEFAQKLNLIKFLPTETSLLRFDNHNKKLYTLARNTIKLNRESPAILIKQIISYNKELELQKDLLQKLNDVQNKLSRMSNIFLPATVLEEVTELSENFDNLLNLLSEVHDEKSNFKVIGYLSTLIQMEKNCDLILNLRPKLTPKIAEGEAKNLPFDIYLPPTQFCNIANLHVPTVNQLYDIYNALKEKFMAEVKENPLLATEVPELQLLEQELQTLEASENDSHHPTLFSGFNPKDKIIELKQQIVEYAFKIDFKKLYLTVADGLTDVAISSLEAATNTLNYMPDFTNELSLIKSTHARIIERIAKGEINYETAYNLLKNSCNLFEAKREWLNHSQQLTTNIKTVVELANNKLDETYQALLDLKNQKNFQIPATIDELLPDFSEAESPSNLEDLKRTFSEKLRIKFSLINNIHQLNDIMKEKFNKNIQIKLENRLIYLAEKEYLTLEFKSDFIGTRNYIKAIKNLDNHIDELKEINQNLSSCAKKTLQRRIKNYNEIDRKNCKYYLTKQLSLLPIFAKHCDFSVLGKTLHKTFPLLQFDENLPLAELVEEIIPFTSKLTKTLEQLKKLDKKYKNNIQIKSDIQEGYITCLKQLNIPFFSKFNIQANKNTILLSKNLSSILSDFNDYLNAEVDCLTTLANRLEIKLNLITTHQQSQFYKANLIIANKNGLIDYKNDNSEYLYTILPFITKDSPLEPDITWQDATTVESFIQHHHGILDKLAKADHASLKLAAEMINQLTQLKEENPDYSQKDKESIDQFLKDALPTLLENTAVEKKKNSVKNLAKNSFTHRDKILRLIGDIIQCLFIFVPIVMAVKLYRGESPWFSCAALKREDTVNNVFTTMSP